MEGSWLRAKSLVSAPSASFLLKAYHQQTPFILALSSSPRSDTVDIHPATQAGKILAVVLIITGVVTFLGVVANATEILLSKREKKIREQKLNMVVGMFFSELGTKILSYFTKYAPPHWMSLEKALLSKRELNKGSSPILLEVVSYVMHAVAARSLLCFWATSELEISQSELGQKLKISQPAVSVAVKRLRAIGYTPQLLVKSFTGTYKLMYVMLPTDANRNTIKIRLRELVTDNYLVKNGRGKNTWLHDRQPEQI